MKDIKHIQLESGAFISDVDFQLMDAEQRGVYCSIILYLYANGGTIELNNTDITLLSDKTNKLAMISNCQKTGQEWKVVWSKIAHKFQINGNILTHKRVTKELMRASEYKKIKSEAGKIGMKKRWGNVQKGITEDNTVITKERKVKVSKDSLNPPIVPPKKQFLEFVRLSDEEHKKLIDRLGLNRTADYIDKLNNYIGSKGKKYKSHYHTILNWSNKDNERTTNDRNDHKRDGQYIR
jgi:uncharacterized protein YdaU (DUF1376 family)